jgi:hypothetical protein
MLNEIGSVARADRGKKGVGMGVSTWRQEKKERGGPAQRSIAQDGWQMPSPGGHCCTNRGEQRGTVDAVRERLTGGAGQQRGPGISGGL